MGLRLASEIIPFYLVKKILCRRLLPLSNLSRTRKLYAGGKCSGNFGSVISIPRAYVVWDSHSSPPTQWLGWLFSVCLHGKIYIKSLWGLLTCSLSVSRQPSITTRLPREESLSVKHMSWWRTKLVFVRAHS